MRLIVLLAALAMPIVSWISQMGLFGPDNGEISDRYPTLLVAAGYAFSIWSLIFLLDLVHAVRQLRGSWRQDALLGRIAPATAAGFVLTTVWMPLFSQGLFALCLLVIFGALACLAWVAVQLSDAGVRGGAHFWSWLAISLHAGWLTLAAFLNLAQAALAFGWTEEQAQLVPSLLLLAAATALLLWLNARMRGNLAYAAAALWGLVAVWRRQSEGTLPGSDVTAMVAVAMAVLLVAQTTWLLLRARRHAQDPGRLA